MRAYIHYSILIFTALWSWLWFFSFFRYKSWGSKLSNLNRATEIKRDKILLNSECQVFPTLLHSFTKSLCRSNFFRAIMYSFPLSTITPTQIPNFKQLYNLKYCCRSVFFHVHYKSDVSCQWVVCTFSFLIFFVYPFFLKALYLQYSNLEKKVYLEFILGTNFCCNITDSVT